MWAIDKIEQDDFSLNDEEILGLLNIENQSRDPDKAWEMLLEAGYSPVVNV